MYFQNEKRPLLCNKSKDNKSTIFAVKRLKYGFSPHKENVILTQNLRGDGLFSVTPFAYLISKILAFLKFF